MAAADKYYLCKDQYKEFKEFWLKTRKKQKRELGYEIWLYPFSFIDEGIDPKDTTQDIDEFPVDSEYPVINTSTKFDLWLFKNCNLPFIQERVQEKLNIIFYSKIPSKLSITNFKELLDFSKIDRFISIGDILFITKNRFFIDKMIVYGTSLVFDTINKATKSFLSFCEIDCKFTYCGLYLRYDYKNSKLYLLGDNNNEYEIIIGFIQMDEIKLPSFKYSFNLNDVKKYTNEEIIVSNVDEVYSLSDCEKPFLKREILFLPEIYGKLIK